MKRRIWLSLGSNIEREKNIKSAVDFLGHLFGEIVVSPIYESEAVGFDGEAFFNLVVGVESAISLKRLNKTFRRIEDEHGRVRGSDKFAARTLDIDILTFGDWVSLDDEWDIPRAEITEYAFVLLPLSEVAENELHPVLNKTYGELWEAFNQSEQKLWLV